MQNPQKPMDESPDAQTQLKKRARRRLMGAIAFAGLAAVVLPMVMDEEPKQQLQDVQIRIPGQDQATFAPSASAKSTPASASASAPLVEKPVVPEKQEAAAVKNSPTQSAKDNDVPRAEAPVARPTEKITGKAVEKNIDKASEKALKSPEPVGEAQRAASILAGKASEAATNSVGAPYVILLGAFTSTANVKQLQSKMAELGIKTYTEVLESPEGKKTRLRAGPFASREAADKALDKIKRIGVSGVVAVKQ